MTSKTQDNAPSNSNVINAKKAFTRAADLAQVSYECLTFCEALFAAIQNAKTLSHAKAVANVGHYLSTDQANIFDCDREKLIEEMEALS